MCLYPFFHITCRLLVEVGLLQCFRWSIPLWRILRTTRRWPVYSYLIFLSKMSIYRPHIEVCNLSIQIAELLRIPDGGFFTQILKLLSSFTAHLKTKFSHKRILTWRCTILCAQITLLYANVSPDDILLKQKLDALQANHPNLKVESSLISSIAYFTSIHHFSY